MDIPARYRKKICGMCGNFNGNQRDDMMNFDGKRVAKSLKEFLGWMKVDYEGDLSKVWVTAERWFDELKSYGKGGVDLRKLLCIVKGVFA